MNKKVHRDHTRMIADNRWSNPDPSTSDNCPEFTDYGPLKHSDIPIRACYEYSTITDNSITKLGFLAQTIKSGKVFAYTFNNTKLILFNRSLSLDNAMLN